MSTAANARTVETTIRVPLLEDPKRGLPEAELAIQIHKFNERMKVHATYLKIKANDVAVATSGSFDRGAAVVDFAEDGSVIGFEFLGFRGPDGFPEFIAESEHRNDPVWHAAIVTSMAFWTQVQNLVTAVSKNIRKVTLPNAAGVAKDVVARIPPDKRWQDDSEVESGELQTA